MTPARLIFVLGALGATLCAGGARAGHIDAWTQITPQGTEVRAAVSDGACPTLDVDGVSQPMALRAAPDDDFPVRLCQALVPAQARAISLEGQALPAPI